MTMERLVLTIRSVVVRSEDLGHASGAVGGEVDEGSGILCTTPIFSFIRSFLFSFLGIADMRIVVKKEAYVAALWNICSWASASLSFGGLGPSRSILWFC